MLLIYYSSCTFICLFLFIYSYLILFLYFFFSSRRRHTRCLSDWSSDVCSSDLWPSESMQFSRPMTLTAVSLPCSQRQSASVLSRVSRRASSSRRWQKRCSESDRKSTRLNSSHLGISYAVFCLKKNKK